MKTKIILIALMALSVTLNAQVKKVKHVILIGCDGLGAYAIPDADMLNLKNLMEEGASTLKARSVLPSSRAVNWASMIMGAGPTFHGYTEWGSKEPEIPSIVTTEYKLFPSIFSLIRQQKPSAKTAAVYSWAEKRDRIDFIYCLPNKYFKLTDAKIVGRSGSIKNGKRSPKASKDQFIEPLDYNSVIQS